MHRPGTGRCIWPVFCLGLAALVCSSCGGSDLAPVRGKVLYKGQPAKGAMVIFHPADNQDPTAVRATGIAGEDGTFTLSTHKPNDGARPGQYVVTVVWLEEVAPTLEGGKSKKTIVIPEAPPEAPDRLKGKYANQAKSNIRVEVKKGTNELEPFNLD